MVVQHWWTLERDHEWVGVHCCILRVLLPRLIIWDGKVPHIPGILWYFFCIDLEQLILYFLRGLLDELMGDIHWNLLRNMNRNMLLIVCLNCISFHFLWRVSHFVNKFFLLKSYGVRCFNILWILSFYFPAKVYSLIFFLLLQNEFIKPWPVDALLMRLRLNMLHNYQITKR